jgi:hypothetical protein
MKTIRVIGSVLFVISLAPTCFSQTFFCSAFSVTNVYPDTINPGDYQLSIQCIAGPNEFVSYPFVPIVLDCNGDTVATGGMFYFGQLGQTTQDYPVTLTGNGDITCYPLTASFIINYEPGFTDTCQLTYNSTGLATETYDIHTFSISPNPAYNQITLTSSPDFIGAPYAILDLTGKMVASGVIDAEHISIDTWGLSDGIYILNTKDISRKIWKRGIP